MKPIETKTPHMTIGEKKPSRVRYNDFGIIEVSEKKQPSQDFRVPDLNFDMMNLFPSKNFKTQQ